MGGIAVLAIWIPLGPASPEFDYTEPLRIQALAMTALIAFVMGLVAILGDRDALLRTNRRVATRHRNQIIIEMTRYTFLFYVYLSVLFFTFLTLAIESRIKEDLHQWLVHAALGGGMAAVVWSLGAPAAIRKEHKDRLDDQVRNTPRASADDPPS